MGGPSARRVTVGAADAPPAPPPPSSSYVTICLIGYSMSFIIFGSQVSILGPTIKPLAERLGVDEPDLSPLFTALGISCIVSGTPSGWLVDRMPTHHVLIGSLLVQVRVVVVGVCVGGGSTPAPGLSRAQARWSITLVRAGGAGGAGRGGAGRPAGLLARPAFAPPLPLLTLSHLPRNAHVHDLCTSARRRLVSAWCRTCRRSSA
jgi:hypothetical protein